MTKNPDPDHNNELRVVVKVTGYSRESSSVLYFRCIYLSVFSKFTTVRNAIIELSYMYTKQRGYTKEVSCTVL